MSCYNRDLDRSVGVCCHNALGLVRTVRLIPRANALGIWLPVSHAPSCIVTTNPSRTGLNPLNHTIFGLDISLSSSVPRYYLHRWWCGLIESLGRSVSDIWNTIFMQEDWFQNVVDKIATVLSRCGQVEIYHCSDVIMSAMVSQITGISIVFSTVYSGADLRKHRSLTSLAFVRWIRRWPVNSPHEGLVTG